MNDIKAERTPDTFPSKEELHKCLEAWLPQVESYLKKRQIPPYTVPDAVEKARAVGLRAIFGDLHDRMKPEEMTSGRRRAWLLTVALYEARTILRPKKRRKNPTPLPADDLLPPAPVERINPHVRQSILDAVQQLSPDDQEVIEAVYFAGLSRRQYAELLDVGEATVRRRHDEAVRRLRQCVKPLSSQI